MNTVMIGVIGSDADALEVLYQGLKEFPAQKVVLITDSRNEFKAFEAKRDLEKIKLDAVVVKSVLNSFEELFSTIAQIKSENSDRLVLNVDCDYGSSCIMLSAAFVNGVQAIGLLNNEIIAYPIMKFSYYTAITEKKMAILRLVAQRGRINSLEEISQAIKMSLPLVTYHIRGSREKVGLEELGLVATKRVKKTLQVELTPLGRLLLKGSVESCRDCPPVGRKKKYR